MDKLALPLAAVPAPRTGVPRRDLEYVANDFVCLASLAYAYAGISLGPNKEDFVYSRLAPRLRRLALTKFADYIRLLNTGDLNEQQEFVNALTTNYTEFFREAHHFPVLVQQLLEGERQRVSRTVWCAACATGEEAYSIAIALIEAFDSLRPPVQVLASDIDTDVLARAVAGVYPLDKLASLSEAQIERFFDVESTLRLATVRPALRRLVAFRRINLLDPIWMVRPPLDAIFCRNVMIYFDPATQERMLSKFAPLMHPGGLLFVGHAENYTRSGNLFELQHKTVYRLSESGRALAARSAARWRPAQAKLTSESTHDTSANDSANKREKN